MIIYKVTNNLNQQTYVGQTTFSLEKRRAEHEKESLSGNRKTVKFHNALLKYGFNNFTWEVIKECNSQEELDYYEDFYIKEFQCLDRDKGYNLKSGGKLGGCYSEEAKQHMGESTKKKWENPEKIGFSSLKLVFCIHDQSGLGWIPAKFRRKTRRELLLGPRGKSSVTRSRNGNGRLYSCRLILG